MGYPDTPEKRRAGMAAFRARLLAAHERLLNDPKQAKDRAYRESLIASIKAAQVRHGEVQS